MAGTALGLGGNHSVGLGVGATTERCLTSAPPFPFLAQGTGRLIRSVDDRGVVAILDSRIVTKRYGSVLLNSMPPLWRTSDKAVVQDSLKRLNESL